MLLNDYCMAACYSADEDGTVQLPYDTATGELRPEFWERWLAWDPVRMAPSDADALRSLKAIYIDSGKRDQFFLDLGAEAFRRELEGIGVTDYFFELFDGDALGDRVPLPAGDRLPGRAAVMIAPRDLPRSRPRDAAGGGSPGRADRAGLADDEDQGRRRRGGRGRSRARDRDAGAGAVARARLPASR